MTDWAKAELPELRIMSGMVCAKSRSFAKNDRG